MGSASPLAQKLFLSDLPKEASRGLFPSCFHGSDAARGKARQPGRTRRWPQELLAARELEGEEAATAVAETHSRAGRQECFSAGKCRWEA